MRPVVAVCQKPKPKSVRPLAAFWAYLAVVNAAKSINDAKKDSVACAAYSFAVTAVAIVTYVNAKMAAAKSANVSAVAANASMSIATVVEAKAATRTVAVMTIKKVETLSYEVQDAIAARLIPDFEDKLASQDRFAATTDEQWDKLADMVRQDIADGDTMSLDDFLGFAE